MLLWTQSALVGIQEKPNSRTPKGQKSLWPCSFYFFLWHLSISACFSPSLPFIIFSPSLSISALISFLSLSCFAQSIAVPPSVPLPCLPSFLTPLYSDLIADHYLVSQFSRVQLFATPWATARQVSLSITNTWSLLKLMSMESVMLSNHHILCHPLLLLPSIFPNIRVFSNESVYRMRWPEYSSFSFNINPFNEHSGLISFRIDWFHLLTVEGTLKSLLQYHSAKASILQHPAFFVVQLSHPYMTTGKP